MTWQAQQEIEDGTSIGRYRFMPLNQHPANYQGGLAQHYFAPELLKLIDEAKKKRAAMLDAEAGLRRVAEEHEAVVLKLEENTFEDAEYGALAKKRDRLAAISSAANAAYQKASYAAHDAETLAKAKFALLYIKTEIK